MPDSAPPTVSGLPAEKLMAAALSGTPVSSPAFAWVPPAPEEVAKWFPEYEVQALAGRGAMGAVYRAIQKKLERPVAIKLLPAELAARDGVEARFVREARALALLNHPGIVALHDYGRTDGGHLFIVMEYVDGTDLSRLIHAEGGGLSVEHALEIVGQVCDALQYAHSRGFVHRDIKPGNVLVDKDGRVKIADFGLAKVTAESGAVRWTADAAGPAAPHSPLTLTGQALGTPDYTAPEQLKGGPVDHRADIYSLGVMFYEMLTGELPRGAWAPPSTCTAAPARLDEVVTRAMQTEPANRYQQASEVKAAATAQEPAARAVASYSSVNHVMLWLMFAFIVACAVITPTGDALTMLMLAAPFIALAVYFKLKRRPAGFVALLLAGLFMGAGLMFSAFPWLRADKHKLVPVGSFGGDNSYAALLFLRENAKKRGEARNFGQQQRLNVLHPAMQQFRQAMGDAAASAAWAGAANDEAKYQLLRSYAPYSPPTLRDFPPQGMPVSFTSLIPPVIHLSMNGEMAKFDAFVFSDFIEIDGQSLTDAQFSETRQIGETSDYTLRVHLMPGVSEERTAIANAILRKLGLKVQPINPGS